MQHAREIADFVRANFRSVWSLELLLFLKRNPDSSFAAEELVGGLRASQLIVASSCSSLLAAGLILEEEGRRVRYAPATDALRQLVEETETLYRTKPDAVRRAIIMPGNSVTAFADAFRIRKD